MTKLGLRRLWFRVHQWIGLALMVLFIPLTLSGAALVWDRPHYRLGLWIVPPLFVLAVTGVWIAAPQMLGGIGSGPTDQAGDWQVMLGNGGDTMVAVPDGGGAARLAPSRAQGGLMGLMRQIHSGARLPFIWQLILLVTGIVPSALAATGVAMWWRARRWRARAA